MKKRSIYFLGLVLAFVLFGFQNSLNAQDKNPCEEGSYTKGKKITKIEDIKENLAQFNTERVVVVGVVRNFIVDQSNSLAYYELEGKYGDIIRVRANSEKEPKKLIYYVVEGIVYIQSADNKPFIHEESRIECIAIVEVKDTSDKQVEDEEPGPQTSWIEENLIIVIIGISILILIIIVVIVVLGQGKKKQKAEEEHRTQLESQKRKKEDERRANEQREASQPKPEPDDDFKTIKIFIDDPKTMKFIPGKLEIISGDDKGRTFLISGYPTPEGSVVTIGRENVIGDRRSAHIQLDKRFQTVSRKQAELIYKSGKLFARNVSDTNPTQVDGSELKVGQMAEVKPGSIIRTGELEFKYVV